MRSCEAAKKDSTKAKDRRSPYTRNSFPPPAPRHPVCYLTCRSSYGFFAFRVAIWSGLARGGQQQTQRDLAEAENPECPLTGYVGIMEKKMESPTMGL